MQASVKERRRSLRANLSAPEAALLLGANAVLLLAAVTGAASLLGFLCLAIPLSVAVAHRPQRGLLALVALTPFDGLLEVIPHPPVAAAWKEVLLAAVLAATFVAPPEARGAPGRRLPPWATGITILFGLGVVSAVRVGNIQGLVGVKIVFFYVLAAVAVWRCPFDRRDRDQLITVLMVVGFVTSVIGLAQQVMGPARLNNLGYEYNSTIRFSGGFMRSFSTFIQPFGFGFFVMTVLLLAVPVAFEDLSRRRNRLFVFATPLLGLAVLSTIVRGAWLGLAVGVVYLGARRYRALLLLIPLAAVAVVALPPEAASSVLSSSSSVERTTGWGTNLSQISQNPLGVGIGATGGAAVKSSEFTGLEEVYQPDNFYMKVTLELGVLGLWLFVLVLASTFTVAHRQVTAGPPE
ncbi:MAG: O-antigen ligase family protein, partial [Actinomycetota bacterium]|nr:O-antigen ligase family protein [Actinomycetota bacterium]